MTPLRAATIAVANVADAVARYGRWMDYRSVEQGIVPADLAASWDAPDTAGRPYALMMPASDRAIFLRFVEADPVADYRPLRSYGWAAIELCVQDVAVANARMAPSPFAIIGPPARNPGLATIHPMQVLGADGEVVFLSETQVGGSSSRHPVALAPIDSLFILVLACPDMATSAAWFGATLSLDIGATLTMPYSVLSDAFGQTPDTPHQLTTATHAGAVLLEFDRYPAGATARPRRTGQIPPGIAIGSFACADLDRLGVDWITPPCRRPGALYGDRRVGTVRSPDGALVELIEAG